MNSGALANDAGLIHSGGAMTIDSHGAGYDNKGGQTLAGGDLRIDAGAIDNTGALIRSGATTTLNAGSIANADTLGADQGIEGDNVAIATGALVNTSGAIRANLNATLTSSGTVDNTSGLISAGDTVAIVDPNAPNPAAKTLDVTNTGGTVLADKRLAVDAASLGFDGKLLSGGDMRLALTQDVVTAAGSRTIANRDLSVATRGNVTHGGMLAAGNALTLSARSIDNTATGDIQGASTTLSTSGTVTNRGVIDGFATRIDAGTLDNIGTGRIYGDQISIGAGTLNNLAETVNGLTSAATIAARDRLDIGAQTIGNRDGSLIFSAGDLVIGGSLDADGRATGAAAALGNHASTIEAAGNAGISAAVLNNTSGGVTWTLQPGTSEHVVEYAIPGNATRHPASEVLLAAGGSLLTNSTGWNNWVATDASNPLAPGSNAAARLLVPSPDYPLERFRTYYLQSPANSADRSYQTCNVDTCETTARPGAWYAISDPIWSTFGVAPPAAELPTSHPGRIDPHFMVGQEGLGNTTTMDVNGVATPLNRIKAIHGAGSFQGLGRNLINGTTRALVDTAISGASLEDSLTRSIATAFIDTGAALGATAIGANTAPGSFANFAGHLIAGCATGALRADRAAGCGAGALGATLGEATALVLNGNRTAEDILANGLLPGTLEMASLVGGLGVALAGGDASLVYLGAGAGSNAAENNMAGQLTMLVQNVVRFNQAGWQALSAAGQVAILRCAANNWCASLPLMAAAVGYVNSAQFAANQPSLADQIPTGYGAGGVRVLDGSTSTSADVMQGANTTATPATALVSPGTPGYGASNPTAGGTSTVSPHMAPAGGSIVLSQSSSGHQLFGNQLPSNLAAETAAANAVGVRPIPASDPSFPSVVNQGQIKFVVTAGGQLLIAPHTVNGIEISHAVLSNGQPVIAAGQANIAGLPGALFGLDIEPYSGHFLNGATPAQSAAADQAARTAFSSVGINFPERDGN
ncbi:adhesin HecA family 20-residue repeat (two copies) [Variovorax sp. RA8]|nr:adhesin HecA family 20-residue repeat (two copies) [Variovorax sp. RA8]